MLERLPKLAVELVRPSVLTVRQSVAVEVYSDAADEGRVYEGTTTAHATTGAFSWNGIPSGPNVTVTATDSQGNTSEFSTPWSEVCYHVVLPLVVRDHLQNGHEE